jgi:hypothetical protein
MVDACRVPFGARLGRHAQAKAELDGASLLDFLLSLLSREEAGEQQPCYEGANCKKCYGRENFAEMEGH